MKKIITILCSICLLTACTKKETKEEMINKIISSNNYIIVDVRTNEEYTSEHIKDAINIPYDEIDEKKLDKEKKILVYCQSGKRSQIAYETLKKLGYDVLDLGAFNTINLEHEK